MRLLLLFFVLSIHFAGYSQDISLSYSDIPKSLLTSANSVLRFEKHHIEIPNQSTININHRRIMTVLNKAGNKDLEAYLHYDDVSRVKSAKATFYDKNGNKLKEYKRRDFKDISAVDGISLYTDSRIIYIDYTPTSYPYTLVLESETTSKNTAIIPDFYANEGYYSSTQEKHFEISYKPELELKFKTSGDSESIVITEGLGILSISVKNTKAIVPEVYSPGFRNVVGKVSMAINNFHLEGVNGNAQDWNAFGRWMNNNLLTGTRVLPQETIATIKELVMDIENPIDKARAVYRYVQERTRYISVQVGIGGWKPMLASQVDKLGYGDCKALTNYTKSLLDVIDVPSYYTVLYGSSEKRNIDSDFTAIQGNHVILSIPRDDDYIWLECTDQNVPFGFIAGFTDDRDVLVVKPGGGEIVHTTKYKASDNFQTMKGSFTLDKAGRVEGKVEIKSGGLQYGDRYSLEKDTEEEKKKYYYKYWDYLNNLNFSKITLDNDKETVIITENVSLEADNYAAFAGEEMLVPVNLFNRYTSLPDRVKNRKLPVEVMRGFKDSEEIEIQIPQGFEIIALPDDNNITTEYGTYQSKIEIINDTTLLYKRAFEFFEGRYVKGDYNAFRNFIKKIIRSDQQKLVIKEKSE